jgi:hypothetical protein
VRARTLEKPWTRISWSVRVAGDDQRQPDQSQIHALLFRFAALGDRGAIRWSSRYRSKLVMSNTSPTTPPRSSPNSDTIRCPNSVIDAAQRPADVLTHRGPSAEAHQLANANFEHGATTLFAFANPI